MKYVLMECRNNNIAKRVAASLQEIVQIEVQTFDGGDKSINLYYSFAREQYSLKDWHVSFCEMSPRKLEK